MKDDTHFQELASLLKDRRFGNAREMLCLAIAKTNDRRAVDVLIQALKDPDLEGHAVAALGRIRPRKALRYLLRFLNHPKIWIRREAKKAIQRIESIDTK